MCVCVWLGVVVAWWRGARRVRVCVEGVEVCGGAEGCGRVQSY